MWPFVDPVPPTGRSVCLHRRPSQLEKSSAVVVGHGLRLRVHAPQPGQHVGSEHCNPRAGGDTGQSLLGARFAVRANWYLSSINPANMEAKQGAVCTVFD